MTNDVAIFLDLDNLVIGAKQANLTFDINLIVDHIKKMTNGRVVLRRSYGDWRQNQQLMKNLAVAGFTTQSTIRINNFSKNLADMQIVVDTMDTLIDGHQYSTYVLITGDRDFTPLVQSLRKRGKRVIGLGVKHTASRSFVSLCDQYVFYEEIIPTPKLTDAQVESLLRSSIEELTKDESRIRASILKQQLNESSNGAFDKTPHASGSFRKFLEKYPHLIEVQQVGTTLYVRQPQKQDQQRPLHKRYRSSLKKQRLRIVPTEARFQLLKDIITVLSERKKELRWRELIDLLYVRYQDEEQDFSKNVVNSILLVARRAQVVQTIKGRSLSTAVVLLELKGPKMFQEAVMRCDAAYLREILALAEPFDLEEAAIALYYTPGHTRYLKVIMKNIDQIDI
ncbi:MAG: NYN domain-containing protein [Chloroflexi bacterium]|nr:NYN domain-containing protein [Chloroflexota bacterium]